jgi:hypothetical protein
MKTDRNPDLEIIPIDVVLELHLAPMASSSSNQIINLGSPPSDKLTRANYLGWRAQVLPAIRNARLLGLLDGTDAAPPETLVVEATHKTTDKAAKTTSNPEYYNWISIDHIVLSYLLQSLSSEVLPHVQRIEHATGVWQAIEEMFASTFLTKM